ncbi:hypothetical protein Emed_004197 [Eimeria media]
MLDCLNPTSRRKMRSRLSETEQNLSLASSAKNEQSSGAALQGVPLGARQPAAPFVPASGIGQRSPRATNLEGGGDTGGQQGGGDRAGLSTHKLPLSAAPLTPQEDLCAFHSPRSFPGDSVDDRASPGRGLEEEAGAPQQAQERQEQPGGDSEKDSAVASGGPSHGHEVTGGGEVDDTHDEPPMEEQRQLDAGLQEQQLQQAQQDSELNSGVSSMGASAMSECEGGWIRIEESCSDKPAPPVVSEVVTEWAQPAEAEPLSEQSPPPPPLENLPPESAPPFPICIGSAVQAGGTSAPNRSAQEEGVSPGHPSCATDSNYPPQPSSTEPSDVTTSPKGLMSCLFGYATSVGRSVAGCCTREQHQEALASETDEGGALSIQQKTADSEGSRCSQETADWHRSFLDLYGGPCEEIMRLALQVLPAQATDYQSERRLLFIQGLFDVFCLYRSHFLSPTEGLLHAEALHQRGRLRAERSLGSPGGALPSSRLLTDSDLFGVEKVSKAESEGGGEGLPVSVRLALYGAVSLALKIVRALQLLLEVNKLRRGGEGQRFALCMRLELLKLVLKMILYSLTPFAFYCDEQSISQAVEIHRGKQIAAEADKLRPCYGRRTGRRIHPLPSALSRVPEIFVEAQSVSLLHGSPQVMERLSPIEAAELRRRVTGLPYALLRPPFFDSFLARPFEAVDYIVRRVPLLNHFNVRARVELLVFVPFYSRNACGASLPICTTSPLH